MMYGGFARAYDCLMADVDYDAWTAHYLEIAAEMGVNIRHAAECGCGTGAVTLRLAARGINMTGLDVSEDMLRIAGENARKRGLQVPFICQDMRALELPRRVDAVFSACDGVNYLTGEGDAAAFFRAAYAALKPGGGIFFDISSAYKIETVLGNNLLGGDGREAAYLWQNSYNEKTRVVQMDLSVFIRQPDERYIRCDETHFQRAYDTDEILDALGSAGFAGARAFGQHGLKAPGRTAERIFFAARKPAKQEGMTI